MTLDESARRLGALVWTERWLFELLGGWVVTTPEAAVKVELARVSRRHGAHALALADLLPETRDHDPDALVAPPEPGDAWFAGAAAASASGTDDRLAVLDAKIAPAHLGALEAYLADATAVRDGPAIRVVGLVLAEDATGYHELSALGVQ
jgi:hypothetical protein